MRVCHIFGRFTQASFEHERAERGIKKKSILDTVWSQEVKKKKESVTGDPVSCRDYKFDVAASFVVFPLESKFPPDSGLQATATQRLAGTG